MKFAVLELGPQQGPYTDLSFAARARTVRACGGPCPAPSASSRRARQLESAVFATVSARRSAAVGCCRRALHRNRHVLLQCISRPCRYDAGPERGAGRGPQLRQHNGGRETKAMRSKISGLAMASALALSVGNAAAAPNVEALEALGKQVFFDEISVPARQSCATCHVPSNGFTAGVAAINLNGVAVTGANPHRSATVSRRPRPTGRPCPTSRVVSSVRTARRPPLGCSASAACSGMAAPRAPRSAMRCSAAIPLWPAPTRAFWGRSPIRRSVPLPTTSSRTSPMATRSCPAPRRSAHTSATRSMPPCSRGRGATRRTVRTRQTSSSSASLWQLRLSSTRPR